jgi:Arc/MetJ family transcription regulator
MRATVVLDDELVREASRLVGARKKTELISTAFRELVRAQRKKDLSELAGRFHHEDLRKIRG